MSTEHNPTNTSTQLCPDVKSKIDQLFTLPVITLKDIEHLTTAEVTYLSEKLNATLDKVKDKERDTFIEKVKPIFTECTNAHIWQENHFKISRATSAFVEKFGVMPPLGSVAGETGLSRQTVAKHLKEYRQHPQFAGLSEQLKFMAPTIAAGMLRKAVKGDAQSARLYLEMVGAINKQGGDKTLNAQNNFIQINNTILSQENLERLTEAQLKQIENIVKGDGTLAKN